MSSKPNSLAGVDRIRVTLDLRRSDDPALFEALASLPKGRRRIARLRVLAHDGMLGPEVLTPSGSSKLWQTVAKPTDDCVHEERVDLATLDVLVTSGIFEQPISH